MAIKSGFNTDRSKWRELKKITSSTYASCKKVAPFPKTVGAISIFDSVNCATAVPSRSIASRLTTRMVTQEGMRWIAESVTNPDVSSSLSANGSKNAPKRVR